MNRRLIGFGFILGALVVTVACSRAHKGADVPIKPSQKGKVDLTALPDIYVLNSHKEVCADQFTIAVGSGEQSINPSAFFIKNSKDRFYLKSARMQAVLTQIDGKKQYLQGQASGPVGLKLPDLALDKTMVTCHNSKAQAEDNSIQFAYSIPNEISAETGEIRSIAKILIQSNRGALGIGMLAIAPEDAQSIRSYDDLDPNGGDNVGLTVMKNANEMVLRLRHTSTSARGSLRQEIEAVYSVSQSGAGPLVTPSPEEKDL